MCKMVGWFCHNERSSQDENIKYHNGPSMTDHGTSPPADRGTSPPADHGASPPHPVHHGILIVGPLIN